MIAWYIVCKHCMFWVQQLTCNFFRYAYYYALLDIWYYIDIVFDTDAVILFYRSENGIYYALHVGGTNFRILRIQLGGQRSILGHEVERKPIPQLLMTSTSEVFRRYSHDILLLHMNFRMFFCRFRWINVIFSTNICRSFLILLRCPWRNLLKERGTTCSFHKSEERTLALHFHFLWNRHLFHQAHWSSGRKVLLLKTWLVDQYFKLMH